MEIKGRIEAEFTLTPEESAAILQGMLNASTKTTATALTASTTKPEPVPAAPKTEQKQSAPQPSLPPVAPAEPAEPAAPATPQKETGAPEPKAETPELAVDLLKQQFEIKPNKNDRSPEEQKKAVALNRTILVLIRDITGDGSAQSLADLRDERSQNEFIRRSQNITYDVGNNTFKESVFYDAGHNTSEEAPF